MAKKAPKSQDVDKLLASTSKTVAEASSSTKTTAAISSSKSFDENLPRGTTKPQYKKTALKRSLSEPLRQLVTEHNVYKPPTMLPPLVEYGEEDAEIVEQTRELVTAKASGARDTRKSFSKYTLPSIPPPLGAIPEENEERHGDGDTNF